MRKIYFLNDVDITYNYVNNPFNQEFKNKEFKGLDLWGDPRVSITYGVIECSEGKRSCGHAGHGGNSKRFQFKNYPDFTLEPYIYKGTGWRKISIPNLSEKLIPGIYIGYLESDFKGNIDHIKDNVEPWKSSDLFASWTYPNLAVRYFPVYISKEGYTGEIKEDSRFYSSQKDLIEKLENSIIH